MSETATWTVEMKLNGTDWTDVSNDVILPVRCSYGIRGNGPLDRVATTGTMKFQLDNSASNSAGLIGYYSPGHVNCRSGFGAGLPVRISFTFHSSTYVKFVGRIPADGIEVKPGVYGTRRVNVEVHDWMDQAFIHPLYLPTLVENKRIDEIVPLIVANMPIAPGTVDYNSGSSTFDAAFDTVRERTTAAAEFNKLALSELGYIYIKRDFDIGETLEVDGRTKRSLTENCLIEVSQDYLGSEDLDFWITDEDYNPIYIQSVVNMELGGRLRNPSMYVELSHGKHLYNDIRYTTYPTYVDGSATTVLFSLNSYLEIPAGGTVLNILGRFRDPSGGAARVSGRDMVDPVGTVDYAFNAASDGSGSDLTANLSVTAGYGTEGVNYSLVNSGGTVGYVTKLQARGKGIYTYDPLAFFVDDSTSKNTHGTRILNLDLKYEKRIGTAQDFATAHLGLYKSPKTLVETVRFLANYDYYSMYCFLGTDIGDKFSMADELGAVSTDFFLNGIDFEVLPGNVIFVNWMPSLASNDVYAFWMLGDETMSELGVTTILSY